MEEYTGIDDVCEMASFINEHGAIAGKLLEYFQSFDNAKEAIEGNYHGVFSSVADFAEELTSETTQVPENLRYYIDYERMARDLEINDVLAIETGFEQVHIFWRF